MTFEYTGVAVPGASGDAALVLFSAPAREIAQWVGIPQRRRISRENAGNTETAGFQREEKKARVTSIAKFLQDGANLLQNPLLAAVQDSDNFSVEATPASGVVAVRIATVSNEATTLVEALDRAIADIEQRVPDIQTRPIQAAAVTDIRRSLAYDTTEDNEADDELAAAGDEENPALEEDTTLGLFDEETQVVDFYDELRIRREALRGVEFEAVDLEEIAGFSLDYLISLTQPVVLVDGQHRLRGALESLELKMTTRAGQDRLIELLDLNDGDEEAAEEAFAQEHDLHIPISLMLNPNPAEHVFQFVVVNQKATPMSPALLGTIVSTSLSKEELAPIRQRLENAGIQVGSSEAIAFMSRSPRSPFQGLVATGISGDQPNSLPFSVLGKLISVFQDLKGATYYHAYKNIDWAAKYSKSPAFQDSAIFPDGLSPEEKLAFWGAADGPWRELFLYFFTRIREHFGDTDLNAHNAWGTTRSNLFNMVSLSIMAFDFFNYVDQRSRQWHSIPDMKESVDEWLAPLNPQYYARDWRMKGAKKDQPFIKNAWCEAWTEYRMSPERMPRLERYNPAAKG